MNEQIIEFLTELRSHNNREWFQDNKSRYDALRKVFIDEVQDLIGRISLFRSRGSRVGGERLFVPDIQGYPFLSR